MLGTGWLKQGCYAGKTSCTCLKADRLSLDDMAHIFTL